MIKIVTLLGLLLIQSSSSNRETQQPSKLDKSDYRYFTYTTATPAYNNIMSVDGVDVTVGVDKGTYTMTLTDPSNKWRCYPISASAVSLQITCVHPFKVKGE